jgi:hypothetical protein
MEIGLLQNLVITNQSSPWSSGDGGEKKEAKPGGEKINLGLGGEEVGR